ncbi:MAG: ammonium transporter, partial [Nocardioidaceae bacterium]
VHINAGMAALVLVLVLGARRGFRKDVMRPHNLPFTMLGAGLLWFGWFGFNVGSIVPVATQGVAGEEADFFANSTAFAENFVGETGLVWVNTTAATAAAMLGWLLVEKIRDGKGTSLGAASGVVAGLVAITPACGALSPVGSIGLGALAGALAALAVGLKYKLGYDDSLDVVGVHLVAGLVGTISIGFLATTNGLFYGGGFQQLVVQVVIALFAIAWSGAFTLVIALALKYTMGWRISDEDEVEGIDFAEHGETAYDFASRSGSRPSSSSTLPNAVKTEGVSA